MSTIKVQYREDRKKWQVRYYVDGIRKRPLFDTEQEALNIARKINLGLQLESKVSITIAEAAQKYFFTESAKKSPKSKTNDKRYLNLLEHFMFFERGIERIGTVNLHDMECFRDWLIVQTEYDDKPMAMGPATANRCISVLKHFFKKNVQWGEIQESPCVYLDFLQTEENKKPAIKAVEFLKLVEVSPDWFKPVLQFMYCTGAAASSVARFKWSDADMETRVFSLYRKKGKLAKWRLVTQSMIDPTFAILLVIQDQRRGLTEGLVFRDANGIPLLADRITKAGNAAMKAAGLNHLTMYSIRHALATDLAAANVTMEIIRQVMGHASILTTQRYANKVGLETQKVALELVRGVKLVANGQK